MNPLEGQRLLFREKFRAVFREEFAAWFAELARAMHPAGDFQEIRLTQGDSGIDGFAIDGQVVYQVFAPPRMDELRDGETATKIADDFGKAFAALGGKIRKWIFVHNHPEGKLGRHSIVAISKLRAAHAAVQIEVWNDTVLWEKVEALEMPIRERLFPSGALRDGSDGADLTELIRQNLLATGGDFAVPALDLRLPMAEAWDRLRWMTAQSGSATSLDGEIQRYYEWARLARMDVCSDFPASAILSAGRRTVIVGGPGSGKSTLVRKLAWLAACRGDAVWRVSLRAVARLMERGCVFSEAVRLSALQEAALVDGAPTRCSRPAVVIADGLDEAEPNRVVVAEGLRNWALANAKVTVVVTTRPIGHAPGLLPTFANAELLPLSEKAIRQFARSMFQRYNAAPEAADRFLELIQPPTMWDRRINRSAGSIASRSPLLLSFLVALYLDGRPIVGRRSELYEAIVDLGRRGSGTDRPVPSNLPAHVLEVGLDALAWAGLVNPGMERTGQMAVIASALRDQVAGSPDWNASEIVSFWIERRMLELIRLGRRESLVFVHPTLAEFCAARHLQHIGLDAGKKWLADHRRSPAARETILLACGSGAAHWVVPELLRLDTEDVCASEAVLAASALAECKVIPEQVVGVVSRRIAHKLVSPVPLVSTEAAESLCAVADAAGTVLHETCPRLYEHEQPWTCLGARALGLAAHDPRLSAREVGTWLVPDDEKPNRPMRWSEWPDHCFSLRVRVVDLGFNKIFAELPPNEARELAECFLATGSYSVLEAERLDEILSRHGCADLLSKRHERWTKRLTGLAGVNWETAADHQTSSLLKMILAATGYTQRAEAVPPGFVAETLGDLLGCIDFWEIPISAFWELDDAEGWENAVESTRGAIAASGVTVPRLALDINVLLSAGQNLQKYLFDVMVRETARTPDWSSALNQSLDATKLLRALLHPSDLIKAVAARVLGAGSVAAIPRELAREVLFRSEGSGLHYVAQIACVLWRGEHTKALAERLDAEPHNGLEHVCRELGRQAGNNDQVAVRDCLLNKALSANPVLAAGAAEGLSALSPATLAECAAALYEALSHWLKADITCANCGVRIKDGHCPECHVIPTTPQGGLIRALSAINAIPEAELIAHCKSEWYSAKDAALEIITRRAGEDPACLRRIVSGVELPNNLLESLLRLPEPVLAEAVDAIIALQQSPRAEIRLTFMKALPSLPVGRERELSIAREGLADPHASVRDAAARVLRLRSQ